MVLVATKIKYKYVHVNIVWMFHKNERMTKKQKFENERTL